MNKLTELFEARCVHRHTKRTHPHCFREDGNPIRLEERILSKPMKLLTFDVETLPLLGYAFNPWNTNITPVHLVKDICLLSYAARWYGDDKIISEVLTPKEAKERDDKRLCVSLSKLLEEAEVVIVHNGKRFDIRILNARLWKNKIQKPSSYKVIDTLSAAKSVFGLTYNSVSWIAKFIEADEKLDTDFELWRDCDNGMSEALQYMREYNEQDVITQEKIYEEMRGWIPNHPDLGVYVKLDGVCPVCLSTNHKEIGLYTANKLQYPEHRCSDCKATWHDSKAIKEK